MNTTSPAPRLTSIDAYRGFVMFLMMAEVLHLKDTARQFKDSPVWQFLGYHQDHVPWAGCSLHDLIQPSFSFLVGVALPFSIAARVGRGQSFGRMTLHAAGRALVLILLGVFLRSVHKKQTHWTFEDTLSQIGLGYVPLFLLGFVRPRWQVLALVCVLVGYWGLFAAYPLPGPDHDFPAVGVAKDWPHHPDGFAAHWDKNSNPAWAFDTWFLNLFPREMKEPGRNEWGQAAVIGGVGMAPRANPFTHNGGGYATLSFIPTLGTMILGLLAGGRLKRDGATAKTVGVFVGVGVGLLAAGVLLDRLGVCPNVKRIWTPTWVLFSGGWCFLILAGFAALTDMLGRPGWSYPLRVIGANSIVAYVLAHLIDGFILSAFKTHLGAEVFQVFGPKYEAVVGGAAVLGVFWLGLWWLYRNRVFVRI